MVRQPRVNPCLLLRALSASVLAFALPLLGGSLTLARPSPRGQGLVEYAVILGFVALLILVALRFLQPAISTSLNNVANSF